MMKVKKVNKAGHVSVMKKGEGVCKLLEEIEHLGRRRVERGR
jgi:hypothetical protein